MNRTLHLLLLAVLCVACFGCGGGEKDRGKNSQLDRPRPSGSTKS